MFSVFSLQILPEKDSRPVFRGALHYFHGNKVPLSRCEAVPGASPGTALQCHPCGKGWEEQQAVHSYLVTRWRQP